MLHIMDEEGFIPSLTLPQKREKDYLKILELKTFPGTLDVFLFSFLMGIMPQKLWLIKFIRF